MPKVTIEVPEELKARMEGREEVNWAGVLRKSIERHLRVLQIADQLQAEMDDPEVQKVASEVRARVGQRYRKEARARRR